MFLSDHLSLEVVGSHDLPSHFSSKSRGKGVQVFVGLIHVSWFPRIHLALCVECLQDMQGIGHKKAEKVQRWEYGACVVSTAFSFIQDGCRFLPRTAFIQGITFCFLCRCCLANCVLEVFCLW